ncbi:hypothetical protein J6590_024024 [Homalodisca vitripennis]|nr:hypothetical protein J6590_024024 [Homalodisca vitripennis]
MTRCGGVSATCARGQVPCRSTPAVLCHMAADPLTSVPACPCCSAAPAYELSTLTGTQVMLLVASETGHVYTFATRKLQPMITSEAGKALIQTCLNSPDPCPSGSGGDQRMSATGFEETELSYNIGDDEQKVRQLVYQNPPSHSQHFQQHHSPHHQHHMMIPPHPHAQIPCSSPGPMLGSGYQQQCPSPYPTSHHHMH